MENLGVVIIKGKKTSSVIKFLESREEYGYIEYGSLNNVTNVGFTTAYCEGDRRTLTCLEFTEYGDHPFLKLGENYTRLSMGSWGTSTKILLTVLSKFGGYVDFDNCDDIGFQLVKKGVIL